MVVKSLLKIFFKKPIFPGNVVGGSQIRTSFLIDSESFIEKLRHKKKLRARNYLSIFFENFMNFQKPKKKHTTLFKKVLLIPYHALKEFRKSHNK